MLTSTACGGGYRPPVGLLDTAGVTISAWACQSTPHDAIGVGAGRKRIKQNFRLIETMGVPVVSCLNGSTLGGGWEVMLVGHHRTAIDDSRIRLGLPAVEQRADQAEQPRHLRHAAHAVQQDQRHGCRSSASSGR